MMLSTLLLGFTAHGQEKATKLQGKIRTYYVAADEVNWNYAPAGRDEAMGQAFDEISRLYTQPGPHRIGAIYKKAIYREYTDASFSKLKVRPAEEQYLGLLGPILRGEVGDTIRVVFKNKRIPSLQHASARSVLQKRLGRRGYNDKTSAADKERWRRSTWWDTRLHMGNSGTSGPGSQRSEFLFWLYHSHADELRDVASGLFGAIVVTRRGSALPDGRPKALDREFVNLFIAINENESWYLEDNIRDHATDPRGVNRKESPLIHSRGNGRNNRRDRLRGYQCQVVH